MNKIAGRRQFLKLLAGSSAIGALAACAAPAAPGEGSQAPVTPAGGEPGATPQAVMDTGPRVGGTYRIVAGGDFVKTLDPGSAEAFEDWWSVGQLLFNMPYAFDREGNFYPDLAADLPKISSDGKVYTIPLRKGVKFHNGREMTAEDVKFTIERQLWPEVYSWGKSYLNTIVGAQDVLDGKTKDLAGVKVVDPYTVEITLDRPQAVFAALMSITIFGVVPKKEVLDAGQDWGTKVVIGTGPFKFVEWQPQQRAVFERNPNYFKPGKPYIERVELNLNVEESVRLLRWESGEADFLIGIPPAEFPRILADENLKDVLRSTPTMTVHRFNIHMTAKPLDNLKVRQAIAHAIDKNAVVKATGAPHIVTDSVFAIAMPQYDPNFRSNYQYDPDKARALLKEAGYENGVNVGKILGGRTRASPEIEVIHAQLKAVGIESEIVLGLYNSPEIADRLRSGDITLHILSWSASYPDGYDYAAPLFTCKAREAFNRSNYCNPRIDELLDKAEGLPLTSPERIAAYREINDIMVNRDVQSVPLFNQQAFQLSSKRVRNDLLHPIYGLPVLEDAWIAM
ncbi:MAG: ABC transporter substrate-binding protein [Anaerolineae bacterium]|nr:ABC transporter substrate-binding protein [Candidatus Roseilinea sp.]MDW8450148.1 ABC transporter substrate-binding protein [Anaerolineae bacterium]